MTEPTPSKNDNAVVEQKSGAKNTAELFGIVAYFVLGMFLWTLVAGYMYEAIPDFFEYGIKFAKWSFE